MCETLSEMSQNVQGTYRGINRWSELDEAFVFFVSTMVCLSGCPAFSQELNARLIGISNRLHSVFQLMDTASRGEAAVLASDDHVRGC